MVLALISASGPAAAQETSGDDMVKSLSRCRSITSPDNRLICFDKATAALEAAVQARTVTIIDRQDVKKARRSLFGFSVSHIPFLGGGKDDARDKEFEELTTTIVGVAAVANGRFELRLAEGDAVWMTTDPMAFPPKTGVNVRVKRGAMGSYFIAIAGERSVRGVRVR